MSTIKVDNIQGTSGTSTALTLSGANSTVNGTLNVDGAVTLDSTLAVTGVHTVGSNAVATSDGGSATMSIIQGLAKQWSRCQDAAMTVKDSFNTSSVTDSATGKGAPQFTSAMSNANYCNVCGADDKQDGGGVMVCTIDDAVNQATSGYGLVNKKQTSSAMTVVDLNQNFSSTVFGDLA